jgi:putative redox protein
MVQVDITYDGDLRCTARHGPSGATFPTDAPLDNHGKGEAFSPTDLVGTALGTCILTIMGIVAQREGIDLAGTRVTVQKEMVTKPIRRIGKLAVTIHVPRELDERQRILLHNAAHTCPVHHSLHPDVEAPIVFVWAGEV